MKDSNRVGKQLSNRIAKELKKGPKTAQRRITAKKKELVVDRDIAALLVAHELKIDISNYATVEQIVEVRKHLPQKQSLALVGAEKAIKVDSGKTKKKLKLTEPEGASADPYLKEQDLSAARFNAELYPALYAFENSVRRFISSAMEADYKSNWWQDVIAKEKTGLDKVVLGRMRSETKYPWHSRRGAHEIYYTDIEDLINILNTYGTKKKFFKALDGNLERVRFWIDDIKTTRNILGHNNPVSKVDRNRLAQFARDWHDFAKAAYTRLEKIKGQK